MARRRPVIVAVRLTPDESADWRAKAKAAGVPLSALIRRAMAHTRTWTAPAAEVERERTRQVSRIGNNLNQIARWANTHKGAVEAVEVIGHLIAIKRAVAALSSLEGTDADGVDAPSRRHRDVP
jgi:hypothetical protein